MSPAPFCWGAAGLGGSWPWGRALQPPRHQPANNILATSGDDSNRGQQAVLLMVRCRTKPRQKAKANSPGYCHFTFDSAVCMAFREYAAPQRSLRFLSLPLAMYVNIQNRQAKLDVKIPFS